MRAPLRIVTTGTLCSALIAAGLGLMVAPASAFTPSKVSSITIDVDGLTLGIDDAVTDFSGPRSGVFGGASTPASGSIPGSGELTEMYAAKDGSFVNFEAQGGVILATGGTCGSPGVIYRRAQVTIGSVPTGSRVWVLYDATIDPSTSPTPQFNSNADRITSTSSLEKLCDGMTLFVDGSPGVLTLGDASASPSATNRDTAGTYKDASGTSVSFDVYVPTYGSATGGATNLLALGIVVDAPTTGTIDDSTTDTAIFTHITTRPWFGSGASGFYDDLIGDCAGGEAATADPCIDRTASGVFQSDGTTRIGSSSEYSVSSFTGGSSGESQAMFTVGLTAANGNGFAIPSGSIAKMSLSLPTSGLYKGINWGAADFSQAAGNTGLLVNTATSSSSSNTNRWDIASSGGRVLVNIIGQARATSSAISRSNWYSNCQVSFSGSTASSTGCGEGMTSSVSANYMVVTTVPAQLAISVSSDPVMQTIAGGLVSTNAQGMTFGGETMTGESFQFAVAGPSYDSNNTSRSSDGYYYVCVPQAFLSGSFGTTPADAVGTWIGTRDGATVAGTTFAVGNCGIGPGLVASLDPFGYSVPVFSVRPPTSSSGSAPSSGSPSTNPAPAATQAPAAATEPTSSPVPIAVPVVYPSLAIGKSVKPDYLLKLAEWTPGSRASVKISVPKMFRSVCVVRKGQVVALKSGTCGVRIKVTSPRGKVYKKRVYLTAA